MAGIDLKNLPRALERREQILPAVVPLERPDQGTKVSTAGLPRRGLDAGERQFTSSIFRCPVLRKILRGDRPLWTCQFCQEEMRGSERKAREHAASHLLSADIIALNGVMPRGPR